MCNNKEIEKVAERVMELFREISAIPRPSHHEEKIADYICDFAKARGHEVYRDELHNVLVNVKATKGCENVSAVLLQGHTDMVCEKNSGVEHDFLREGIKLIEKDGFLTADGTTLGADNGVAVAVMLYVIDGGVERHGDVQCLFTVSEETGLNGVNGFDYGHIYSKKLINMDGGGEGSVIVGCAGGVRSDIEFEVTKAPLSGELLQITVSGLYGGHSGEDIIKGRANANVLMAQLLSEIYENMELSLVSINGGTKDNAIPRECIATISVGDASKAEKIGKVFYERTKNELSDDDAGFEFGIEKIQAQDGDCMIDAESTKNILTFISCTKNGILEMSKKLKSLVEYSKNLGVIRTENNKVVLIINSRSANERQIEMSMREIEMLADVCSAKVSHRGRYAGWEYAEKSELADEYMSICKELYGTEVKKNIIHAGLECGIIKSFVDGLDCISCGPNMRDLHSPDETLDIASFGRFAYAITKLISAK